MYKKVLLFLPEEVLKDFDLICKNLNIERSEYIIQHVVELKERLVKKDKWKFLKK